MGSATRIILIEYKYNKVLQNAAQRKPYINLIYRMVFIVLQEAFYGFTLSQGQPLLLQPACAL